MQVLDIVSDAKFILLVEKDAAFMRLAEDRFYNDYPCIILTAKGQPDVATRLFLKKLKAQLDLPVLALVDADPYGLKILSALPCFTAVPVSCVAMYASCHPAACMRVSHKRGLCCHRSCAGAASKYIMQCMSSRALTK